MKKSSALKNVSISPIEETVDEAMAFLPDQLDLTVTENRMKMRTWMVRVCGVVATKSAEDFSKAAASAIQEAAALSINPQYNAERKRSKAKYKAMRALSQVPQRPVSQAERAFYQMGDDAVKM